ncbi:hypothetical protein BV25DRAFT_637468 [Artomyces pyxidatus]|uniref:Uncharacterized protein n=1 Tax=Artomyces pyxidatus TaxID=48021 RepID=A0ACB8T2X5_9AGAM|nr:hypothetical protein BV25DRAFT_637468 [Artomyces pyxidatus]
MITARRLYQRRGNPAESPTFHRCLHHPYTMPTFLSLPSDVLLTIRDTIIQDPTLDLFTHVALSRTCRRLRSIYDFSSLEVEQRFWKRVCVSAGFGRPMRRERPQVAGGRQRGGHPVMTWKTVAHLIVAHERVCEIRSCREANLWHPAGRSPSYDQRRDPHPHASGRIAPPRAAGSKLAFHPLFYYLHFSPTSAALDPTAVLFTALPTFPDCRFKLYAPLAAHPSASCAFVTSPPVRQISFLRAGGSVIASVVNPDGCTVLDVNRLLADIVPRDLAAMRTVLSHYQTLVDHYRAPSGTFAEAMCKGRHRGFLGDHRYPYLDVPPSDFTRSASDERDLSLGPVTIRCDNGGRAVETRCYKVLSA